MKKINIENKIKKEGTVESVNISFKDIIEIICNYDVTHTVFPPNKLSQAIGDGCMHGLVCDDERKIYLDKDVCHDRKRLTVIHEMLHCYSYLNSLGLTEGKIKRVAQTVFKELYGHRYGSDAYKSRKD